MVNQANAASQKKNQTVDDSLIYILNDTHIGEKHAATSRHPKHLSQAVRHIISQKKKPAAVIVNGDLAMAAGQPGDYRHFAKLIQPLRNAKIDVHLTMGNHDNRNQFYRVMKNEKSKEPVVASKHVSVVQTKHANFFLLDSLIKPMTLQGNLGKKQLLWLTKALDAMQDKPAIIVAHHNPCLGGDPQFFLAGIMDSYPLWNILTTRKHVKAYIHGHVHYRSFATHEGIHIINTPATASPRAKLKLATTGWTTARIKTDHIVITTHTTNEKHPWNKAEEKLKWR